MEELAREFPEEVIAALKLLTHDDDTPYFDYVRAIKSNPIARKVKLADLNHNSDQTRCVGSDLTEEQLNHWKEKYAKAKAIVLSEETPS
jgi:hypothetical protein